MAGMVSCGQVASSWRILLCFTTCIVCAAADGCTDMYEVVLKRPAGVQITPAEVGGLYSKYCKKNMKVSSAKSMDELCAPLVRKIEEKMRWVPPDFDVTPEIACKSVDKLKEQFPERVATAEAQLQQAGAEEKKAKEVLDKAKVLKNKLSTELKDVIADWGKELVARLGARVRKEAEEVIGPDFSQPPKDALAKQLEDAAALASRGLETKLVQKLDEAVGGWASSARKEARARAAPAEL
mmetsp:Transcript_51784/g.150363  ORF Transcript_51784/g.150363 Transcript_51784/m.150363 type:complete len:239 (-) Transcript_51784:79-795(-)